MVRAKGESGVPCVGTSAAAAAGSFGAVQLNWGKKNLATLRRRRLRGEWEACGSEEAGMKHERCAAVAGVNGNRL